MFLKTDILARASQHGIGDLFVGGVFPKPSTLNLFWAVFIEVEGLSRSILAFCSPECVQWTDKLYSEIASTESEDPSTPKKH